MKQLIKNKRFEVIKALVESKKIKQEWLEDLYSILLMEDYDEEIAQTKYEIVKLILSDKQYLNVELLSKTLNIDKQTAEEIANNRFIEFEFPTIYIERPITVKGLVVPLSNQIIVLNKFVKDLFPFKILQVITNKGFLVVFNKYFNYEARDFHFALAYVLLNNKAPENFLWGQFLIDGTSHPYLNYNITMKEFAEYHDKQLITSKQVREIKDLLEVANYGRN
jgi:hypothetical protein